MDSIPIVSQVKSFVQWVSDDSEGARQTQQNFSKQCPIVSQARSVVHAVNGDYKQAKQVQRVFLKNAEKSVDGIPVVGHIKGVVHYSLGEREKGDNCMKSASRTTGTLIGGAVGGLTGGKPGAFLGGVTGGLFMDQVTTGVDSLVHDQSFDSNSETNNHI